MITKSNTNKKCCESLKSELEEFERIGY